jgi:poly-gamma-glutamate capsule biosynthesis protein CapA/YwtB (metallophosphatase superfamily)
MRWLGATVAALLLLWAVSLAFARKQVHQAAELEASDLSVARDERTIVLVGDIMTWDRTARALEQWGANYPFVAVAPLLASGDLTVGNLEGPIAEQAKQRPGRFSYRVPPWTLKGLRWAGFDLVSLANNHVADCGDVGVLETLRHLSRAGIGAFGAGRTAAEARQPAVLQVGEVRVAFCGMVAAETTIYEWQGEPRPATLRRLKRQAEQQLAARPDRPGAALATEEQVERAVRAARETADVVVLYVHWGVRYHRAPTRFQRRVGRAAISAGADLVVGHHAHFWQPVELYQNRAIVYGVGNFAFGSNNRRADEALLVRAVLRGRRLVRVELFPLYTKNRDPAVHYQPKLLRGATADWMLARLVAESKEHGTELRIAADPPRAVLGLPAD